MAEGWIKLHRRLLDWEWFDDHNTFRLFTYILLKANYEPKNWHGIPIGRGQLLTSLPSLSDATGISVQSIRTSLTKLKSTGELTDKPTSTNRLLTVVNYDEYQTNDNGPTGTSTGNLTDKQQTTNRQLTSTKEVKNIKELKKKEDIGDFDSFWLAYGKIGNKQQALKAYTKAIKEGINHETILRGLTNYQNYCRELGQEQRFIKHASTWINNRGWEDDYIVTEQYTQQNTKLSKHERAKIALGLA